MNEWKMFDFNKLYDFVLEKIEQASQKIGDFLGIIFFVIIYLLFLVGLVVYIALFWIVIKVRNRYVKWKTEKEKEIM